MCQLCEFQRLRIEVLEKENQTLKQTMVRKESSLKDYLKRLQDHMSNPDFNQPILNISYDESNRNLARK